MKTVIISSDFVYDEKTYLEREGNRVGKITV